MMLRRKVAILVSALVLAVASGTAAGASARSVILPWWQQTVYALGPNDSYVAEWTGSSWTEIGGPASHLYVGSAGVFATDPTSGNIAQYNASTNSWTVIGGPGMTFTQSGGHLYGLSPQLNYVAEWNGTPGSWTIVYSGDVTAIAGGGDGLVATLDFGNDAYVYNGTPGSWTQISGPNLAYDGTFAVGDAGIYVLDDIGQVEQWTGSGQNWTLLGSLYNNLYVGGASNNVYATSELTGDIQVYDGSPNVWTTIGGPGAQFAVSRTALYGLAPDSSYVARYLPSTGWNEIGGAAAAIAADG
jgi:hypothetical protein